MTTTATVSFDHVCACAYQDRGVRALRNALLVCCKATSGHCERVGQLAKAVTLHLWDTQKYRCLFAERVALAGALHDLGKLGIPDAILNKPGRLTESEESLLRGHPLVGESIAAPLFVADPGPCRAGTTVLAMIRHHHERWDGAGYPDGLAGEAIPLGARILAVCDSYDAMTSDRPYRTGMSHKAALSILQEGAGTQWDPAVVQAFVELFGNKAAKKEEQS